MTWQNVIEFWFDTLKKEDWFKKNDQLDKLIKDKFEESIHEARNAEYFMWRDAPLGRLAEILVLDQFSRNVFRGNKECFAQDSLALVLAQEAVRMGADKDMSATQKSFLYMPYMHSESLVIHDIAVKLFDQPGLENNLIYEHKHREIIKRFGRYPHRNEILGRNSSSEEIEFLKTPGSSF